MARNRALQISEEGGVWGNIRYPRAEQHQAELEMFRNVPVEGAIAKGCGDQLGRVGNSLREWAISELSHHSSKRAIIFVRPEAAGGS